MKMNTEKLEAAIDALETAAFDYGRNTVCLGVLSNARHDVNHELAKLNRVPCPRCGILVVD